MHAKIVYLKTKTRSRHFHVNITQKETTKLFISFSVTTNKRRTSSDIFGKTSAKYELSDVTKI